MSKSPPRKSRGLRYFVLALTLGALAFGGFYAFRLVRGIELPTDPLANVPRSSRMVGFVRFGTVLRSDAVRLLVNPEVFEGRLERFRERCHLDPAQQLEDVIVFVEGQDVLDTSAVGVVARGPFDLDKLRTCFREAFSEEGLGETRVGELDGVPIAIPANSEQRAAFLGMRGIAVGTEAILQRIIDVVRDGSPSGRSEAVLDRLWNRVAPGSDIVVVGHLPSTFRQQIAAIAGSSSRVTIPQELDDVVAFGAGADVANGLDLSLTIALRDETKARDLLSRITSQVEELTNNMFVSLTPFGAVVRSIRTDRQGTDLLVTVELPKERLERVIEFASAWRSNLAEGRASASAANPGTAPGPAVATP